MSGKTYAEKHAIPDEGGMPTDEELRATWAAIADVDEFRLSQIASRVLRLVNQDDGTEAQVTYEDIGQLLCWLDHMRSMLNAMSKTVGVLEELRPELDDIARNGVVECVAAFDEHGKRRDFAWAR